MSERDTVTVEVHNLDLDVEESKLPLGALIADLQRALDEIPVEFRDKAVLRISGYGEYVSVYAHVEFERPETDVELEERKRQQSRYKAQMDARERMEFERLKRKFGA